MRMNRKRFSSAPKKAAAERKAYKARFLLCTLTAALLLLHACSAEVRNPDPTDPAPYTETAVRAVTEPPSEPPTDAATEMPTEPPTQPFSAIEIDDVGSDPYDIYDATGFVSLSEVILDLKLDIRYYSDHNFVGTRIDGYEEPLAILTKEAAKAIKNAADDFRDRGYGIVIYDAYRPQRAVNRFVSWANDYSDTKMKAEFYPDLDKSVLFEQNYIGYQSGHSRGSTVDLSLYDLKTGKELDMGGSFDYFSEISHPGYGGVSAEQFDNRMVLQSVMTANGFTPLYSEWWHFSLIGEPYPSTYFDFPVSSKSLYDTSSP